ncbi:hypothetical protein LJ737_16445 [Hymenobacter sp. 15J16-1T3B]|uniref:hypothetical protein n=1 Tax=Hymenobacter sp. 15J16-1T3B TaxID=2886941 RepID=UPI001D123FF1|nr:hypothetical protein [Hymenobacter sp. 15J16-1T3B]MCC3158834.1 hypothetical protein [Hymenobacter sp. 15J16-1T3B]
MFASALWLPLLLAPFTGGSATPPPADYWTDVPAAAGRKLGPPRIQPTRYRTLKLNLPAAQRYLKAVPAEGDAPTLLVLPLPDGSKHQFRVRRSSVMAPELAAKFPELQTFAGQDAADATASLRLELTPTGLRAQIIGYGRTQLIEPYRQGDTQHYICFDKAAMPAGSKQWSEPAPLKR